MGILDFFSKEKRRLWKVEKRIKRANNKFTPKDYRQIALAEVIDFAREGDETAIRGMLARFGVNAEPSSEDEKEKEWVSEALIEIGQPAIKHISRALRSAESVNWVQRVLRNIISPEDYKTEMLDVLSEFDTEYERNPDRKIQTIMALAEIPGKEVVEALIPFLKDVDETVRFQTVIALAQHGDELSKEPLLETMCEDESIRVRNQVIEAFVNLGWGTQGYKKKVDAILPRGYKQDKSGKLVKLGS